MARTIQLVPAALLAAFAPLSAEIPDEALYRAPFVVREVRRADPAAALEDLEAEPVTVWRRRPTRRPATLPPPAELGAGFDAIDGADPGQDPETDDQLYQDRVPTAGRAAPGTRPAGREVAFLLGQEPELGTEGGNRDGSWDPGLPLPAPTPEARFREDIGAASEYAARYAWRPDGRTPARPVKPVDLSRLPPRPGPGAGATGRPGLGYRGEAPDPLIPPGATGPAFSTEVFGPGVDVDLRFSVEAFDEDGAAPPPGSARIEFESELTAETHVLRRIQEVLVEAGFDSPRIVIRAGSLGRNRFEIELAAAGTDASAARRRLATARQVLSQALKGAADPASVVRLILPTLAAPVVLEETLDDRPARRTAGLPPVAPRGG